MESWQVAALSLAGFIVLRLAEYFLTKTLSASDDSYARRSDLHVLEMKIQKLGLQQESQQSQLSRIELGQTEQQRRVEKLKDTVLDFIR